VRRRTSGTCPPICSALPKLQRPPSCPHPNEPLCRVSGAALCLSLRRPPPPCFQSHRRSSERETTVALCGSQAQDPGCSPSPTGLATTTSCNALGLPYPLWHRGLPRMPLPPPPPFFTHCNSLITCLCTPTRRCPARQLPTSPAGRVPRHPSDACAPCVPINCAQPHPTCPFLFPFLSAAPAIVRPPVPMPFCPRGGGPAPLARSTLSLSYPPRDPGLATASYRTVKSSLSSQPLGAARPSWRLPGRH
jgi:hypothetical protein